MTMKLDKNCILGINKLFLAFKRHLGIYYKYTTQKISKFKYNIIR